MPSNVLGAMIGRQLPFIALLLPFYVMALYDGARSLRALWPVLLVAGGSFGLSQFIASNYIDYTLTDVLSSLGSLILTLLFLQVWRPAPDREFEVRTKVDGSHHVHSDIPGLEGWLPWLIVTAVVIVWTSFKIATIGQQAIPWPGLDKAVSITLYNDKPAVFARTFWRSVVLTMLLVLVALQQYVFPGMIPSH
jgi:lactate permease